MTKQQTELFALVAYKLGVIGEAYNPVVIFDTVNTLCRQYSRNDLGLMITGEHPDFCGISEAIQLILSDTFPVMGSFDENGNSI